ncbi:MAG TPA: hypothetical protein VG328_26220 [Stellaceae bacterium]|jgi:hypothetical protein|nr:hypothetical protein [Stellaceae bacterium]
MHAKSFAIIIAIAASCLSTGDAVHAQSGAKPDAIADVLSVFDQICLKRFPVGSTVDAFVAQNRLSPVSDQDLRAMLGTDPGVGFYAPSPPGPYTLTIELPPYHTCAIRKRFPNQLNVRARFSALLQSWMKTQRGATIKADPTQTAKVGGVDSRVDVFEISIPGIREAEGIMAIVTPVQGGGSELRLARAIGDR